jgi:hypothetical protein
MAVIGVFGLFYQMYYLNTVETMLEILGEQPSVAFFGAVLAAQKAMLVQMFGVDLAANLPHVNQIKVRRFIFCPGHFLVAVEVQQFFRRRKVEVVCIPDLANFFQEKLQVAALGEPRQLRSIADTGVNDRADPVVAEQAKKLAGVLACETDGEEFYHVFSE